MKPTAVRDRWALPDFPPMGKARVTNGDLADYDRPPVIEVVYGVRFTPMQAWKLAHIGVFWQRIRDEFPRCEHALPIAGPDFIDPTTALSIPRVWLVNGTDDRLVQLQSGLPIQLAAARGRRAIPSVQDVIEALF